MVVTCYMTNYVDNYHYLILSTYESYKKWAGFLTM